MVQLQMRRSLGDLPSPRLDPGYSVRACSVEDVPALARVLSEAFDDPWSEERTRKEFFENLTVYGTFGIEFEGEIVATASAQMYPENAPEMGTLHWVGALPGHAGHRLGYEACLAAMYELREMNCSTVNLTTDDPRLAAIRTYFKLGFEPYPCDPSHEERWAAVMEKLNG